MTASPTAQSLDRWSSHNWRDGLQINELDNLERLSVRTRNSTYEITVLRPQTSEVLVRGGQFFPDYTRARLTGASLGGSFLKLHGIYVGFMMELQSGDQTVVTTKVRSIGRPPADRIQ
jgi:hypothetical protein